MIIQMTFDTELEPDLVRVEKVLKALGFENEKLTVKTCADIMETARRRSAGEQVIYKRELPKKRGRKPKNKEQMEDA